MDAVAEVERISPSLPRSTVTAFWARGRVVRRPELPPQVAALVPAQERTGWHADAADVSHLTAPVAADLVVLAKLDVNLRPKLRAVYAEHGLTMAAQPRGSSGVCGVTRAVRAHEVVGRHAPHLRPPVLDHGELTDGYPYLVEGWVSGTTLSSSDQLARAAAEVLDGLAAVHRGHGVTPVPLRAHWGDTFSERWEVTLQTGVVPERLGRWVLDLIGQDGTLRHSWTHGDLVASNVLRTSDRYVLLDWEHSSEAPIMNDGAKLHLFAADPPAMLSLILDAFGHDPQSGAARAGTDGGSAYTAAEELALCHAQLISLYPRRRASLAGHPRAEVYHRQILRQVERLAQVRDAVT